MKKIKVAVDRQEGEWAVVVPTDCDAEIRIPWRWLPTDATVNSIISLTLRRDRTTEEKLKEEIHSLREKLEKQ